jgi:outer membrane biosynthesis protein TonB
VTALTHPTEATPAHASPSDYYIWDEPDRPVSIHLNYQTVERLQIEVLRAVDSNSKEGAEIGGILLGRRQQARGRANIVVEDFVPVQCQQSPGQEYRLSAGDALKLDAELKRRKCDATQAWSVLGLFRSHLREGLFLSPDDLATIQRSFADPESVFLLIKVLPSQGCTAAFFFWEDGHVQPECAYNEVPLSPVQICAPLHRENQKAQSPTAVRRVSSFRRFPLRARTSAVAFGALIALAAIFYWTNLGSRFFGNPARTESLGLHVQRTTDHLAVSWNQNSTEVGSANRAVLSIRDGSYQKAFFLNQTQLRAGLVSYRPDTQDIDFGLELFRDKTQIVKDKLHVFLEGLSTAASSGPSPTSSEPQRTHDSVKSAPTLAVVTHKDPLVTAAPRVFTNPIQKRSDSNPVPSLTVIQPPESTATANAPTDALGNQLARLSTKVDASTVPPVPAVTGDSSTAKIDRLTSTPNQSARPQVAPQTPAAAPSAPHSDSMVGPEVLRRVSPMITQTIHTQMKGDIEVDVKVLIDANGQVTDARVLSTKGALPGIVTNEALKAARSFLFKPARANDRTVPSQMVLSFQFRM